MLGMESGRDYEIALGDRNIITDYGKILLRNMAKPETIVGYETTYALIDEIDSLKLFNADRAFKAICERTRKPTANDEPNSIDVVGTSESKRKFIYQFFGENDKGSDRIRFIAKTDDNKYRRKHYISMMEGLLTPLEMEAKRYGKAIDIYTNEVYDYYQKERLHTDREVKATDTLHIGMDLNIDKMAAVVCIFEDAKVHAVDELYGLRDTESICLAIKKKYPNHTRGMIRAYPDASSRARSANSLQTSFQIIKKHFVNMGLRKNPAEQDRVDKLNYAFYNQKALVNSNKCKLLVDCLENQMYDDNMKPDKTKDYDHLIDAFGYYIWRVNLTAPKYDRPLAQAF